jgi:hypothetical protein
MAVSEPLPISSQRVVPMPSIDGPPEAEDLDEIPEWFQVEASLPESF